MDVQTAMSLGGAVGTTTAFAGLLRWWIMPKLNTVCKRTGNIALNQAAIIQVLRRDYPELEATIEMLKNNGGIGE